jgi:hypothetical protein
MFTSLSDSTCPRVYQTLVYGSADSGFTVHNSNTEVNAKVSLLAKVRHLQACVQRAASLFSHSFPCVCTHARTSVSLLQALNLKEHCVRDRAGSGDAHMLAGPFDLEGHLGTDGRFYMLDFARLAPPEPPTPILRTRCINMGYTMIEQIRLHVIVVTNSLCHVFFSSSASVCAFMHCRRMLRMELVRTLAVPLSSDAFSPHHSSPTCESEVHVAFMHLLSTVIPAFATELVTSRSSTRASEMGSTSLKRLQESTPTSNKSGLSLQRSWSGTSTPLTRVGSGSNASESLMSVPRPQNAADLSVFVSFLHNRGINVRHLGMLRQHIRRLGHMRQQAMSSSEVLAESPLILPPFTEDPDPHSFFVQAALLPENVSVNHELVDQWQRWFVDRCGVCVCARVCVRVCARVCVRVCVRVSST